jgi:hypothetical protein
MALYLMFLGWTAACSDRAEAPPRCIPGATIECPCLGGSKGIQACKENGTFEACQCRDADEAADLHAERDEDPRLETFRRKGQAEEGKQFVKKVIDGAMMYYHRPTQPGLTPVAKQFPGPSTGIVPPLGSCCEQGGLCSPDPSYWENPVWQALNFSIEDRHYYSYEYVIDDRGTSVAVRAHGDLDCDGVYSTFEMRAEVRNGSVRSSESVTLVNELE